MEKQYLDESGGTYFCSNFLGYACAKTPFEAMSRLTLTYEGKDPKLSSKKFKEATQEIQLWYIPNADDMKLVENYYPSKGDGYGMAPGTPAGVCLYSQYNHHAINVQQKDVMERRSELTY